MACNSVIARILVVSPSPIEQFVKNDAKTLSNWFKVTLLEAPHKGNLGRLFSHIRNSDIVLCWFGCRMAALAVMFSKFMKKKTIVIAGGQDVANVTEIGYGLMRRPLHRFFIRYAFNNCDAAVAVSMFTVNELLKWTSPKAVSMIYNGVELACYEHSASREGVLCIAKIAKDTIKLKGIITLFEAARLLPDVTFTLVGEITGQIWQYLASMVPQNMKFTGKIDHDSVLKFCSSSRVYVQPSYYESFGVGLAEAMAAGCVPVVTRVGALPEVVGDTGFYVEYGNETALAEAIKKALRAKLDGRAVQRIRNHFTLDQRGVLLKKMITGLLQSGAVPRDLLVDAGNFNNYRHARK
ncbi:MAG: glycosyltransferase family 4 protein [Nitrospiraceae bacterium]|nr:glycosyltransferase family 4 protein [Nitrospiraceae bacterium]